MNIFLFLLILIISTVVSVFLLSKIIIPIAYTRHRIREDERKGYLITKIPKSLIYRDPIFYSIVYGLYLFFALRILSHYQYSIKIGVGMALWYILWQLIIGHVSLLFDYHRKFGRYLTYKNSRKVEETKLGPSPVNYQLAIEEITPLLDCASEYFIEKKYKKAIGIYDKILEIDPNLFYVLTIRAQCLILLNYNLDGIDDYEKAISLDSSYGHIFGMLGLCYQKIGVFDKAEHNLKLAIEKGSQSFEYHLKLMNFSTIKMNKEESQSRTRIHET